MKEGQDKKIAAAIAVGFHVVVFGVLAAGGLFSFLQTKSEPPPVDVSVYNEDAPAQQAETPDTATSDAGGDGANTPTYAAPAAAMPAINTAYTDAAAEARAVEAVMASQHVDAGTAKQVVAASTKATTAAAPTTGEAQGNATSQGSPAGPASASGYAGGQGTDTGSSGPSGNGSGSGATGGTGNGSGSGDSASSDSGAGKRPAKKAKLISGPDAASYYPESLRRQGISGTVTVHIVISPDGTVTSADVASSSGYPDMDAAAIRIAYACQYEPAENEYGQPVAAERNLQIPFTLH